MLVSGEARRRGSGSGDCHVPSCGARLAAAVRRLSRGGLELAAHTVGAGGRAGRILMLARHTVLTGSGASSALELASGTVGAGPD